MAVAQLATASGDVNAPWNGHDTRVLIVAVIGIALIVLLIVVVKMHAFLALDGGGALFVDGSASHHAFFVAPNLL